MITPTISPSSTPYVDASSTPRLTANFKFCISGYRPDQVDNPDLPVVWPWRHPRRIPAGWWQSETYYWQWTPRASSCRT